MDVQKVASYCKRAYMLLDSAPCDDSGDVCLTSPVYKEHNEVSLELIKYVGASRTDNAPPVSSDASDEIFGVLRQLHDMPAKRGGAVMFSLLATNACQFGMTEDQKEQVNEWQRERVHGRNTSQ